MTIIWSFHCISFSVFLVHDISTNFSLFVVLTVELDEPEDTPESNGTAQVCVSVLSGVLQSGLEVVVSVGSSPVDPEGALLSAAVSN